MSYINNTNIGWGCTPQQQTANKIDHIADKMAFAIDMMNNQLIGIDEVEKELLALSNAPAPPRQDQLRAMAGRLDTYQRQLQDGLSKIKIMTDDIDKTTDVIQTSNVW